MCDRAIVILSDWEMQFASVSLYSEESGPYTAAVEPTPGLEPQRPEVFPISGMRRLKKQA